MVRLCCANISKTPEIVTIPFPKSTLIPVDSKSQLQVTQNIAWSPHILNKPKNYFGLLRRQKLTVLSVDLQTVKASQS